MASPDLASLRVAERAYLSFFSWLYPKPSYRTIKIEPGTLTYGPDVIPIRSIVGLSRGSPPYASGTPARQLLDIVALSVILLLIALVDATYLSSRVLHFVVIDAPTWVFDLSTGWKLVVIPIGGAWLLAFVFGTYLLPALALSCAIAGFALSVLAPMRGWSTPDGIGEYSKLLYSAIQSISPVGVFVAALLLYASVSFLRPGWRFRDFRVWLLQPYIPPILGDISNQELGIELVGGKTVWAAVPVWHHSGPQDEELRAVFVSRVMDAIKGSLNQSAVAETSLVDLRRRAIYRSDISVLSQRIDLDNLNDPKVVELIKAQAGPHEVFMKELILLYHDVERISAPEATRILRNLQEIEWFAAELVGAVIRYNLRTGGPLAILKQTLQYPPPADPRVLQGLEPEDAEALRGSIKLAKRAARRMQRPRSDQPLWWGGFSHIEEGQDLFANPRHFSFRLHWLASWIEARISELEGKAAEDVTRDDDQTALAAQ